VFRIVWVLDGGDRHDIGGSPLFAPTSVATTAAAYVAKRILPDIQRDHPQVTGFALLDLTSHDEVFRWKAGRDTDET
jgi:hypothetical protein